MEENKPGKGERIASIAIRLSTPGNFAVVGQGVSSTATDEAPFRIIDKVPVFHVSKNKQNLEVKEFDSKKVKKIGWFYHPSFFSAMTTDFGAQLKFYCDARDRNFYVLWMRSKLDEDALGKVPFSEPEILAWTDRKKDDNIWKASSRLLRAYFISEAYLQEGVYSDEYFKKYFPSAKGDPFTLFCAGSVMKTVHKSERKLNGALKQCPQNLRDHFRLCATINPQSHQWEEFNLKNLKG